MSRPLGGILRYPAAALAIGRALGVQPSPDCRIARGRIVVTFRSTGASRWPEARQVERALRVAEVARAVLASDPHPLIRGRTARAIVVVYEDAGLAQGCAVKSRWECVVPVEGLLADGRAGQ